MKKRTGIMAGIVLAMALGASLGANAQSSDTRMITDLTGTQVEIPEAENIDKVMIVAPPLLSTYLNVVHDDTKLAGINPMSISDMNEELVPMLLPDKDSIRTDFLDGFASNTEEVLKMNPDIILIYGDAQKKGLENIDIPVVNFFIQDQQNESWSVKIDELMKETQKKQKATSVVVTHDMVSACNIADRIAMIYEGELIAIDTVKNFCHIKDERVQSFMQRMYMGREQAE